MIVLHSKVQVILITIRSQKDYVQHTVNFFYYLKPLDLTKGRITMPIVLISHSQLIMLHYK